MFVPVILLGHICQIALSVVHCSMIFMVDDIAGWCIHNLPVHLDPELAGFGFDLALCVVSAKRFSCLPCVFVYLFVVLGVDDCKHPMR